MVQFLSIIFFLGFLQFLLGFSKVPVFCVTLYNFKRETNIHITREVIWVGSHLLVTAKYRLKSRGTLYGMYEKKWR